MVGLVASTQLAIGEERNTSVVNVGGVAGSPVAARLRDVLDERELLARQSGEVTTVLAGEQVKRPDFGDVRKAFADFRYQDAERQLTDLTDDLLVLRADIVRPLAEVLWWRGLIAAVDDREPPLEQRRKSLRYFAAAYGLDPEVPVEASVTSPRVRLLIDEARRMRPDTGTLQLDVDADQAELSIDGAALTAIEPAVELAAGLHLLRVSAPERSPVLRLVEVVAGSRVRLGVELPEEGTAEKVRRLVAETASLPEGLTRMPVLARLGGTLGVQQWLVVESIESRRARVRLYDVVGKRMSQQFSFANSDSSTTVETAVERALRFPEVEPAASTSRWYQKWQVWTAVGGAVLGTVAIVLVVNASQDDPRIRGL